MKQFYIQTDWGGSMLNSMDMGRMESVLNNQDEWCGTQLCSPLAMLLAPSYPVCEQGENKIRE